MKPIVMVVVSLVVSLTLSKTAQASETARTAGSEQPASSSSAGGDYVLGPEDEIVIRGLGIDELSDKPVKIGLAGNIRLPMVGEVKAAGMTVAELEATLLQRLKAYVLDPELSVAVSQTHSQPVSVLGAVRNPGVYQLQGRKTLVEMLSLAGGLDKDIAGSTVKITRRSEEGSIRLREAHENDGFSTAEVSLKSILNADDPAANITLKPNDVITVPRAQLIYVIGQVQRAGGFVLNERKATTVLEALSQAGGIDHSASPGHARILRRTSDGRERTEIPVNVDKILSGTSPDVILTADDILFIPSSAPKKAAIRGVEAAIQLGTGIVIWRR